MLVADDFMHTTTQSDQPVLLRSAPLFPRGPRGRSHRIVVDGKATAGYLSSRTKNNEQVPEGHLVGRRLGDILFELDNTLQQLAGSGADHDACVNLLRQWLTPDGQQSNRKRKDALR